MSIELVIIVISNAVLVGSLWGHLVAAQKRANEDARSVRKLLGLENGYPPAFVRREEWEIGHRNVEEAIDRIERELSDRET